MDLPPGKALHSAGGHIHACPGGTTFNSAFIACQPASQSAVTNRQCLNSVFFFFQAEKKVDTSNHVEMPENY
jgi:hypothetical protein